MACAGTDRAGVLKAVVEKASMMKRYLCGALVGMSVSAGATAWAQPEKPQGTTYRAPSGTTLRVMIDENNLGPEITLGEMVFPPNQDSGDHAHGAIEIFYVVSGELEHVVNGKSEFLKPGMSGYVKPPDKVRHKTGPAGAKVVVVWVPGEEGRRISSRWAKEP
jgi:quercetin dioxygenase-like cupin family protein